MSRNGRVQSIDRAIAVLNCFSVKRKELKLSEIADELDLNKSTVHGIITTLKFHGLIDQDDETQKYRLGLRLLELGSIVKDSLKIREIAKPYIDEICNAIEETVHLGALDNNEVVYLEKAESHQSMRIVTTIGSRLPAYCTGVGKAMLAFIDKDILEENIPEMLPPVTPYTITDKRTLLDNLVKIREQGYALDHEENNVGLSCVAAPIFDYTNTAKYAISISGPTIRMTDEKIQEAIKLVKDAAEEISKKLGFNE